MNNGIQIGTSNRQRAMFNATNTTLPQPEIFPRPTTHDLMATVLRALNARLVCVHLTALVGDVYIAEAVLSHAGGETIIDCRPSDAVAIALRCGAPIRASAAVAALARDIDDVMAILPEHVRTIAAARLAATAPRNTQSDLGRLFAALERAAANRLTADAPPVVPPHRQIEDRVRLNVVSDSPPSPDPLPEKIRPGPKSPQIRVALIRHTRDGKTEIVDNVTVAKKRVPIPEQMLVGLGLSPREAEAVNEAPDEDRWGMLLHILAPETKVPM